MKQGNGAQKKTIKRESIVQAAIEVFGKKDFQSASISEIAEKAGVADGTIYQYFRNKEDLFFSIPIEETKRFAPSSNCTSRDIWGPQQDPEVRLVLSLFLQDESGVRQDSDARDAGEQELRQDEHL